MWYKLLFSDKSFVVWSVVTLGLGALLIISLAPLWVLLCCLCVQYSFYKVCVCAYGVFRSRGVTSVLPSYVNTWLSDSSVFDFVYRLLASGKVPFYFSRLVILLWVKPTDDELLSILQGCDTPFIDWLLQRGLISHFPRSIQTLYAPNGACSSGSTAETFGTITTTYESPHERSRRTPESPLEAAHAETQEPESFGHFPRSDALRHQNGSTKEIHMFPGSRQRNGGQTMLPNVHPSFERGTRGRNRHLQPANSSWKDNLNLGRGNFLMPLVIRLLASRLFDGNNITVERLVTVLKFRMITISVAATAGTIMLSHQKVRKLLKRRPAVVLGALVFITWCLGRFYCILSSSSHTRRSNARVLDRSSQLSRDSAIHRENFKRRLRSSLQASSQEDSKSTCRETFETFAPHVSASPSSREKLLKGYKSPTDSEDGPTCWVRHSQEELRLSAEILSRFIDRHFLDFGLGRKDFRNNKISPILMQK